MISIFNKKNNQDKSIEWHIKNIILKSGLVAISLDEEIHINRLVLTLENNVLNIEVNELKTKNYEISDTSIQVNLGGNL
jgi:hypothetical protein